MMNPYDIITKRKNSIFYCISPSIVFIVLQAVVSVVIVFGLLFSGQLGYETVYYINANLLAIMIPVHAATIIIYFFSFRKNEKKHFDDVYQNKMSALDIVLMALMGIAMHALVTLFFMFIYYLSDGTVNNTQTVQIGSSIIIPVITLGILGPIAEELVCRAVIFNRLRMRGSEKNAILISALVFGLMHMNVFQSSYTFILGVVQAAAYAKYENLLAPIILHMSFNLANFIYLTGILEDYYYTDIALLVVMGAIFVFTLRFMVKKPKAIKKQVQPDIPGGGI